MTAAAPAFGKASSNAAFCFCPMRSALFTILPLQTRVRHFKDAIITPNMFTPFNFSPRSLKFLQARPQCLLNAFLPHHPPRLHALIVVVILKLPAEPSRPISKVLPKHLQVSILHRQIGWPARSAKGFNIRLLSGTLCHQGSQFPSGTPSYTTTSADLFNRCFRMSPTIRWWRDSDSL